jgi:hypothetical protein
MKITAAAILALAVPATAFAPAHNVGFARYVYEEPARMGVAHRRCHDVRVTLT